MFFVENMKRVLRSGGDVQMRHKHLITNPNEKTSFIIKQLQKTM